VTLVKISLMQGDDLEHYPSAELCRLVCDLQRPNRGFSQDIYASDEITLPELILRTDGLLLALFIILFRVKMHFDDNEYFAGFDKHTSPLMYFGIVLAIIVWISMAVAAGTVDRPEVSAWFLLVSILVSTLWIATHITDMFIDTRSTSQNTSLQRLAWIISNIVYCLCLALFIAAVAGKYTIIARSLLVLLMIAILIFEKILSKAHRIWLR
jgi:hypothetical protein